jgi:hypothetical protein
MVSLDIRLRPRNQVNDGVFYTFSDPFLSTMPPYCDDIGIYCVRQSVELTPFHCECNPSLTADQLTVVDMTLPFPVLTLPHTYCENNGPSLGRH